jgi:hypothetical protein
MTILNFQKSLFFSVIFAILRTVLLSMLKSFAIFLIILNEVIQLVHLLIKLVKLHSPLVVLVDSRLYFWV